MNSTMEKTGEGVKIPVDQVFVCPFLATGHA